MIFSSMLFTASAYLKTLFHFYKVIFSPRMSIACDVNIKLGQISENSGGILCLRLANNIFRRIYMF